MQSCKISLKLKRKSTKLSRKAFEKSIAKNSHITFRLPLKPNAPITAIPKPVSVPSYADHFQNFSKCPEGMVSGKCRACSICPSFPVSAVDKFQEISGMEWKESEL